MVDSSRKLDFSQPTGHSTWKKNRALPWENPGCAPGCLTPPDPRMFTDSCGGTSQGWQRRPGYQHQGWPGASPADPHIPADAGSTSRPIRAALHRRRHTPRYVCIQSESLYDCTVWCIVPIYLVALNGGTLWKDCSVQGHCYVQFRLWMSQIQGQCLQGRKCRDAYM